MSRDYPTAEENNTEALRLLADALRDLNETVHRLTAHIDQVRHRMATTEQSVAAARQDAAEAHALALRPSSATDRCLADLMGWCDAILIELEPNGQPKATAFRGAFQISSVGGYEGDFVAEARGEVGERAGGAIQNLYAYMYHSRRDQFGASTTRPDVDLPSNVVRQVQSEGEEL